MLSKGKTNKMKWPSSANLENMHVSNGVRTYAPSIVLDVNVSRKSRGALRIPLSECFEQVPVDEVSAHVPALGWKSAVDWLLELRVQKHHHVVHFVNGDMPRRTKRAMKKSNVSLQLWAKRLLRESATHDFPAAAGAL